MRTRMTRSDAGRRAAASRDVAHTARAATVSAMDLELLSERLRAAGEPRFRAAQVWAWTARGAGGYDAMTNLPVALRGRLAGRGPVLLADPRGRGARARRHGQGAVSHPRRPPGRGRAHALPRRPPLAVPVLAVGLPADLQLLRHRPDEVRAQPHRERDPRPGAALPAHGRRRPRGVHGHGRADDEPRQRPRRLRAPARPGHHAPPHGDLDRGLDPRASTRSPRSRCRSAWRSPSTPPTTRCARRSCRSTTAIRWPTCSPPAGASTRPSAGWSSSST